jgi:hypothetical protein
MRGTSRVDHLVFAAPDLDGAIAQVEARLGVRASAGGRHPGAGTRNALAALGPDAYLEIIAPDPEQPPPPFERLFGIDRLAAPRLVAWAARASGDLASFAVAARERGVALGDVAEGRRKRADGVVLEWRFTDPRVVVAGGIVPFFIDWRGSPHPSLSASAGLSLVELRAEHPEPRRVAGMMRALGLDVPVLAAARPALVAAIAGPRGTVDLR